MEEGECVPLAKAVRDVDRLPNFSDREKLPYLSCVLMEATRSFLHLTVPLPQVPFDNAHWCSSQAHGG